MSSTPQVTEPRALQRVATPPELIEQVIIKGDLSALTPAQRANYYGAVCESLGLNPLTKPFDYIELENGRGVKVLTLYAKRDCTDQLRAQRDVSLSIVGREQIGELYVVTARALLPSGRQDESTGVVPLTGHTKDGRSYDLSGDRLANALMKAETKAKRRVTLSICGLGFLDETEIEDATAAEPTEPAAVAHFEPRAKAIAPPPEPAKKAEPKKAEPKTWKCGNGHEHDTEAGAEGCAPDDVPPGEVEAEIINADDGLRVTDVRLLKSGKNSTGAWNLYGVKFSDGLEALTFSASAAATAKACAESGVAVDREIEHDEKRNRENLVILQEKK